MYDTKVNRSKVYMYPNAPSQIKKKIYQKMIFNRSKKGINKQIFETNNGIDNFVKKSFAAAGI